MIQWLTRAWIASLRIPGSGFVIAVAAAAIGAAALSPLIFRIPPLYLHANLLWQLMMSSHIKRIRTYEVYAYWHKNNNGQGIATLSISFMFEFLSVMTADGGLGRCLLGL